MTVYLLLFIATLLYSFLAHGDSVSTTKQFFRIGRSTTYAIIAEVCPLIWTVLQPLVLKRKTQRELRVIAGGFRAKWDFPNCVGVVDGKEINIKAPPHSGSYYFNYKKFFSIKLLAACDAYYRFIWVDIGNYGSVSDAAAFKRTRLYEALERDEADFPARGRLPRSNFVLPHYLIEDEIFSQQTYMMVPFARRRGLTERQTHFNYSQIVKGPQLLRGRIWYSLLSMANLALQVSVQIGNVNRSRSSHRMSTQFRH